jgi:putative spermidine/putrescine transport system permease protein
MEKIQEKISLVTADGTPLKISLARAQRRSKIVAFMMVFPLLFFVTIAFIVPIADMLLFSIDNSIVKKVLPKTTEALKDWNEYSGELPDEVVFAAMVKEIKSAKAAREHTKIGGRFNYESSGFSSLFRKAGRKVKK